METSPHREKTLQNGIQFPSILKLSTSKASLGRNLSSSDRKRDIEKQFGLDVPKKHDIINMLVNMDKNMDVFSLI